MPPLSLFLIVLALVFFGLHTFGVTGAPRFNFLGAGLFCLTLWLLLGAHPHLA